MIRACLGEKPIDSIVFKVGLGHDGPAYARRFAMASSVKKRAPNQGRSTNPGQGQTERALADAPYGAPGTRHCFCQKILAVFVEAAS
jgi:hypothetical protein